MPKSGAAHPRRRRCAGVGGREIERELAFQLDQRVAHRSESVLP